MVIAAAIWLAIGAVFAFSDPEELAHERWPDRIGIVIATILFWPVLVAIVIYEMTRPPVQHR